MYTVTLTSGQKRCAHERPAYATFGDCEPYALAPQYAINFYLGYFCRWPDMCAVQETPQGRMMGYGTSCPPKPLSTPLPQALSLTHPFLSIL